MDAEQLLRRLGLSGRLKGFGYAAYMIERIAENPAMIYLITKNLYLEAAGHFRVPNSTVERNLRTLIRVCWCRGDRAFLEVVAGTHISKRPTNSEFLDMTAAYLRRRRKS